MNVATHLDANRNDVQFTIYLMCLPFVMQLEASDMLKSSLAVSSCSRLKPGPRVPLAEA